MMPVEKSLNLSDGSIACCANILISSYIFVLLYMPSYEQLKSICVHLSLCYTFQTTNSQTVHHVNFSIDLPACKEYTDA